MSRLSGLVLVLGAFVAAPAVAATPGFLEDFTAGNGGFGAGGGSVVTHVATGGVGGGAFITISNAAVGNLGSFTTAPALVGNLTASGVTGYSFWLRDTGANDNLQIHVGVGAVMSNFWLSIPGFVPPDGTWQRFTVDLTDQSKWVRIIGTGTFQQALANTTHLLFRHDVPPLVQNPDQVAADFGLDRLLVLPAAAVPAVSGPGRVALGILLAVIAGVAIHRRQRRQLASP